MHHRGLDDAAAAGDVPAAHAVPLRRRGRAGGVDHDVGGAHGRRSARGHQLRARGDPRASMPNLGISDVATMEQVLADSTSDRRLNMLLFALLGGLALALATVGVYGVVAYSVSQRTHEIGVRMAIGARPADVVRMMLSEGGRLAVAGVVVGIGRRARRRAADSRPAVRRQRHRSADVRRRRDRPARRSRCSPATSPPAAPHGSTRWLRSAGNKTVVLGSRFVRGSRFLVRGCSSRSGRDALAFTAGNEEPRTENLLISRISLRRSPVASSSGCPGEGCPRGFRSGRPD